MKGLTIAELLEAIQTTAENDGCQAIACVLLDGNGDVCQFSGGDSPYIMIGALEVLKQHFVATGIEHEPPAAE